MFINPGRHSTDVRCAALALLGLCLILLPARATAQIEQVQLTSWQMGIAPGEAARITIVNKDDPEQPIHAELKVFDQEGNQLAERETNIRPNATGQMEIDRDEIPLRGEATGRLQLLLNVKILVRGRAVFSGLSTVSGEIINKGTGQDSIWVDIGSPVLRCSDCRKFPSDGASQTFLIGEKRVSVGLVPGQTARISVFNDDPERPFSANLKVFDAQGNQLALREIVVPPGKFRYLEINRMDLAQPGESPTGRLQGTFTLRVCDGANGCTQGSARAALLSLNPVPLEIVQEGKTTAYVIFSFPHAVHE